MGNLRENSRNLYSNKSRYEPSYKEGLGRGQVEERISQELSNAQEENLTPTVGKIIQKNTLTLFNAINLFLAVSIILVGHVENTLFMGVVLCNTVMGIFQELRSKKTLDKLSVLAQTKATVIRDGNADAIDQNGIVLDDIVYLKAGDQVCADATVVDAKSLELDESLLTGETDRIQKSVGDDVLSGSFVTSGQGYVQVMAVGKDNYAAGLAKEAKKSRKNKSKLLYVLNKIIQIVTIIIIPLGIILFYSMYSGGEGIQSSVLGTSAAIIGMIPNGLVLLTSVTLTIGAMNLAKKEALVQSLPSIETLARVDVLCLDKTGTITDGSLVFERVEEQGDYTKEEIKKIIAELMGTLRDTNTTARSLKKNFGLSQDWKADVEVPFASDRKWSGATYHENGSYIIGAPNMMFQDSAEDFIVKTNEYAKEGYRVLCLAFSKNPIEDKTLPEGMECIALLLLSDHLREDAVETFRYFADEGVTLKVISGDNPRTVSAIATKAGISDAEHFIDMSKVGDDQDFSRISEEYTVFGHVSPEQKQRLIQGLQMNDHTTCMTGDGVNDILAMRESDCSVAMVSGSEAARSACDFVLMSANFSSMTNILKEGRRVINNIERVASLYIVNTIYSILFALIYTFIPFPYPYAPLQMTPINALTVGVPSFFLALERSYRRPKGRLLSNIIEHAVPAALTIVFNTLYIQLASMLFEIPVEESSTMIVFLIGIVGFYLLIRVMSTPSRNNIILLCGLGVLFCIIFLFAGDQFALTGLFTRNVFFYIPLIYFSYHVHDFLGKMCHRIVKKNRSWFR